MLCWLLHISDLLRLKPFQVHLVHSSCLQGDLRSSIFLVKKDLKSDAPLGPGFEVVYGGLQTGLGLKRKQGLTPRWVQKYIRKPFPLYCLSFWGNKKKPQTKHEIKIESTSTNLMTSACSAANIWALCSHDLKGRVSPWEPVRSCWVFPG